mgnify:CR=1 FL=1
MKFEEFEDNVVEWAAAHGIYKYSDAKAQTLKAVSEMGELADNIIKGKDVSDDIGDIIVCLINVAYLKNALMGDCFDAAWNDIKDRKGHMVESGAFVKDSD